MRLLRYLRRGIDVGFSERERRGETLEGWFFLEGHCRHRLNLTYTPKSLQFRSKGSITVQISTEIIDLVLCIFLLHISVNILWLNYTCHDLSE